MSQQRVLKLLKRISSYARSTPFHPQWLLGKRVIPQRLAQTSGMLLDIGAADRWIERHLPNTLHYIALDYPPTGHGLYGAKPTVFADAAQLPFTAAQFDAIVCLEVIEHVPDPQRVLNEIARTLKSGGNAWISMPFLYPLHDAPFDFQRYTEYGLRRCAEQAGLSVERLEKSGHAIRTAGLVGSLALAGGISTAPVWLMPLLLPLGLMGVFFINLVSWMFSLVWPDWQHISHGHTLHLKKI